MKKRPYNLVALILLIHLFLQSAVQAQDILPVQNGEFYSLEVGNLFFEVDSSYGAHITSFKIDDKEILFPIPAGGMGGSTFWHSPQSEWGWPPATVLDSDPYTGGIVDNSIILQSGTESNFNVSFTKTFYGNLADTSITIIYRINNEGGTSTTLAPWEVTRVPAAGIAFWAMGEGDITGNLADYTDIIKGIAWYGHSSSDNGSNKFFSDGSLGYLAHVNEDSILFLKQFNDVPNTGQAPEEAEIELWLTGDHSYIELENQGVYEEIVAGGSSEYMVKWLARKLPGNIPIEVGNIDLVNYIHNIIGADPLIPDPVSSFTFTPLMITDLVSVEGNVILYNLPQGKYQMRVFNLTGKLVQTRDFYADYQYIFHLNHARPGVYIYQLSGDEYLGTGKLIVK